jgi:hypothetical protein
MGCLGVHFALDDDDAVMVLTCRGDESLMEVLEEIEERWDKDWLQETDKAWDAIHRCLTDGTLDCERHATPLGKCVLGGRHLHRGDDYIVCYLTPEEVREVATAIEPIDEAWMRNKYDGLRRTDYGDFVAEIDCDYTWEWFSELQAFYRRAANTGRHVIFTASQ